MEAHREKHKSDGHKETLGKRLKRITEELLDERKK